MGLRYGSLLFANTLKMLGTTDETSKNHLIFRLCRCGYIIIWSYPGGGVGVGVGVGVWNTGHCLDISTDGI